jgi:hypothetical protein
VAAVRALGINGRLFSISGVGAALAAVVNGRRQLRGPLGARTSCACAPGLHVGVCVCVPLGTKCVCKGTNLPGQRQTGGVAWPFKVPKYVRPPCA